MADPFANISAFHDAQHDEIHALFENRVVDSPELIRLLDAALADVLIPRWYRAEYEIMRAVSAGERADEHLQRARDVIQDMHQALIAQDCDEDYIVNRAFGFDPNSADAIDCQERGVSVIDCEMDVIWLICNMKDEDGRSSLCWAAAEGRTSAVAELLRYPEVDIDSRDLWGWTPLWYASNSNQPEIVSYLLGSGADPNLRDDADHTLLRQVANKGTEEVLRRLLGSRHELDERDEALLDVALRGDACFVDLLILAGAPLRSSRLYAAVRSGNLEILELLLEADIHYNRNRHMEPDVEIRKLAFLEAADIAREALHGDSPCFDKIDLCRRLTVLKFFIKGYEQHEFASVGPGLKRRDEEDDYSAIQLASIAGDVELLDMLLRPDEIRWPVINEDTSRTHITPLHFAAKEGHTLVVERLLQTGKVILGCKTTAFGRGKNFFKPGLKAIDIARNNGHYDIVEVIERYFRKSKRRDKT